MYYCPMGTDFDVLRLDYSGNSYLGPVPEDGRVTRLVGRYK